MRFEQFSVGEIVPVEVTLGRFGTASLDGDIGYLPLSSPLIYSDGEKLALHVNSGCGCSGCMDHDGKQFQPGGGTTFADTIPGGITTTATLTPGSYVSSDIDTSGDSDWFGINLVAGQTYTFYTIVSGGGLDTVLTLYNSAGSQIAFNDDANTGAQQYWSEITYTATTSGTFYLGVTGYSTDTGAYYLTSSAPVSDSIPANTSTTSTLTLGNSVSGSLDSAGDHDWYAVSVVAGTTYEFVTSAVGASDVDTTLVLRNASGTVLAYNDDSAGTYSRIVFTASTTGTLYLDVGGWGNYQSGTYQVTMDEPAPLTLWTLDQVADQLENGYWGGAGASRHFNVTPGGTITVNLTALTAEGQTLARGALDTWTDVTGITFSEVTSGGQITFDDDEEGAFASSTRSGGFIISSQVNVSVDWINTYGTGQNTYSFQTYVHEIGHALGLGHAGNYNGSVSIPGDLLYLNDSWPVTVMSYVDQDESPYFSGLDFSRVYITTPMGADIVAMQSMYGVATNIRTGNTTYGFNNNSGRSTYDAAVGVAPHAYAIVDNGGIDTLDYSGYTQDQTINLTQETFSNVGGRIGNVTIGRGTVIENLISGSGADVLTGNSAGNTIEGRGGNDTINGGDGNDILIGGAGVDVLTGGAGNDIFRYLAVSDALDTGTTETITDFAVGSDKIDLSTFTITSHTITNAGNVYTLNAVTAGGTLRIAVTTTNGALTVNDILGLGATGGGPINGTGAAETLTGTNDNDIINGLGGADIIYGLDGDDIIDGGTSVDTMIGGRGNDTYYVNVSGDIITERANEGIDLVMSSASNYQLRSTVENITLIAGGGNATGHGGANIMTGNDGNNRLAGNGGEDVIYGMGGNDRMVGGTGDLDMLYGGTGNDFYEINDTLDVVIELFDEGTDTVRSNLAEYTLGDHVERLALYTNAVNGTGNALNNLINGNTGANTLDGMDGDDVIYGRDGNDIIVGGAGRDQMYGQTGADTFVFDDGDFGGVTAATADRIADFNRSQGDRIDLSLVDAIAGGADNAFNFVGTAAFSGTAGELRFVNSTTHTTIMGDTDGDGVADFWIRLNGVYTMNAGDFML